MIVTADVETNNVNLVIDESEMGNYCQKLVSDAKEIENKVKSYIDIMYSAKTNALISGETADALETYIAYARVLKQKFVYIANQSEKLCADFIEQVDTDDSYVF